MMVTVAKGHDLDYAGREMPVIFKAREPSGEES